MAKSACLSCGSGAVVRTGDSFKCAACGYEWTVADEQANARYLMASQGRKPAQPASATLEEGLVQAVNGKPNETDEPPAEKDEQNEGLPAEKAGAEPARPETAPAADDDAEASKPSSGKSSPRRSTSKKK